MAMFFGTALFCGIIACSVPYFYAYCTKNSDIPEEISEKEEESEIKEKVLVHSLRVKEQGSSSSEMQKKKKITKDVGVNTIESMVSDAASNKRLAPIKENLQEDHEEILYSASTETSTTTIYSNDTSSSPARIQGPIKMQALVHAENPNSVKLAKEFSDERNLLRTPVNNLNKSDLLKQRQVFKKDKSSGKLKKFWHSVKSIGSSTSTSLGSEQVKKKSLSSGYLASEENSSSSSKTPNIQNQHPLGNSTFRNSNQELALKFHEVNGSPSIIHIESPKGSSNSLTISVNDLNSIGHISVPQSQNQTLFIVYQTTSSNSDHEKIPKNSSGNLGPTGENIK